YGGYTIDEDVKLQLKMQRLEVGMVKSIATSQMKAFKIGFKILLYIASPSGRYGLGA
ncbi:hypothetical protein KI387_003178, partial [Taxus chinensis]